MRELTMEEVDLVRGGSLHSEAGPTVFGFFSSIATGAGAGGGIGSALGVHFGYTGDALAWEIARSSGIGAVVAGGLYAGGAAGYAINQFNERVSGMSLGDALYRTFN